MSSDSAGTHIREAGLAETKILLYSLLVLVSVSKILSSLG